MGRECETQGWGTFRTHEEPHQSCSAPSSHLETWRGAWERRPSLLQDVVGLVSRERGLCLWGGGNTYAGQSSLLQKTCFGQPLLSSLQMCWAGSGEGSGMGKGWEVRREGVASLCVSGCSRGSEDQV